MLKIHRVSHFGFRISHFTLNNSQFHALQRISNVFSVCLNLFYGFKFSFFSFLCFLLFSCRFQIVFYLGFIWVFWVLMNNFNCVHNHSHNVVEFVIVNQYPKHQCFSFYIIPFVMWVVDRWSLISYLFIIWFFLSI